MEIRHARSATKHRISRARSLHVVQTAAIRFQDPTDGHHDRTVYLGPDQTGVILEVLTVEIDNQILIIHAMPIRNKFRRYLQGDTP